MRKMKIPASLILALVALALVATPAVAAPSYTISHYEATFELVPDGAGKLRDVAVTLYITYDITSGPKSSGFKFIGTLPVKDISVTDGSGKPLKHRLEKLEENRITWYFPAVNRGKQTVIARFVLVGALRGTLKLNSLRFEWVKNWKVPVHDATYRFILPEDYAYDSLTVSPPGKRIVQYRGRRAIEVHMERLSSTPFTLGFSPGVAEGKPTPRAPTRQPASSSSRKSSGGGSGWLGAIVWIVFFVIGLFSKNSDSSSSGGCGGGGCGGGGCGGGGCGGCGG